MAGVLGGAHRHFRCENVAQSPFFLFESQELAVCGLEKRAAGFPLQSPASAAVGLPGKHRSPCPIAKKAGANEHTGIVIEIKRGTADLDADRQHAAATAGSQ